MIECASCHTLNPEGEARCLFCRAELVASRHTFAGARCAAGHPIDPAWRTCPYCERQGNAARHAVPQRPNGGESAIPPTRVEELPTAPVRQPAAASAVPWGAAGATRLEGAAPSPVPHPTVLDSAMANPVPHPTVLDSAAAGDLRPLVAVLAAPHLRAGGAIFAVRAGKNVLGASRSSDICLAEDGRVSSEHALLLFRGGTFQLADRMSSNGTWLNGREVPANAAIEVQDRDRIRCGGVEMVLLVIDASVGAAQGADLPS
jgi:FHA domain